jgi:hypothetical protein
MNDLDGGDVIRRIKICNKYMGKRREELEVY